MISVIVPNLNEETYLPYFLESLKAQHNRYFELIVVDGGSTDRSRKIIDSYELHIQKVTKIINITRNLGFIRNLGARCARGNILLFTNSDAVLPSNLLEAVALWFAVGGSRLQALSGKTKTINGGFMAAAGYFCFDMLRWLFAEKLGRFSPSGNFLAIRAELFHKLGGFPEVKVNEDGILGQRISNYCVAHGCQARFDLDLWTEHHAKRFRKGSLKTLLFYSYVFGNFSSYLRYILKAIQRNAEREFDKR